MFDIIEVLKYSFLAGFGFSGGIAITYSIYYQISKIK